MEYIVRLGEATVRDVELPDGSYQTYSDKPLNLIEKKIHYANKLEMNNLSSLIGYIKSHTDTLPEKMIIQVVNPTEVRMYSQLDEHRNRELIAVVDALIPSFEYGRFIDHETFCINVQSKFIDDPETDKALLLKFAGTVEAGSVAEYGDDGVTQKAAVKTGIATKSDAVVPNPVRLKPFRTFVEVPQPISKFVFRMKQDKYDGISCALFEADGGAWQNEAMHLIHNYLESALDDYKDVFTVIS